MAIIQDSDLRGEWLKPEMIGSPKRPTQAFIMEYFTDEGVKFGRPKDSTDPADLRIRHNVRLNFPKQNGFPKPVELNYTLNKTNLTVLADALGRDTDLWADAEVTLCRLKASNGKDTIQFIIPDEDEEDEEDEEVVLPQKRAKSAVSAVTPKALPTPTKGTPPPSALKKVAQAVSEELEPVLTTQQIEAIKRDMGLLERAGYTFPVPFTNSKGKVCKLPKFSEKMLKMSPVGQQAYYNDLQDLIDQAFSEEVEEAHEEDVEDYE